jgi:hypothetical protein
MSKYCSLNEETKHKKFWCASVLECGLSFTRPTKVLFRCRLSNPAAIRTNSHRHNFTSFYMYWEGLFVLIFSFATAQKSVDFGRMDGLNDAVYYLQATKGPCPYRYSVFLIMNNHNYTIHFTDTPEINKGRYYSQTSNYNQLLVLTKH